MAIIHIEGMEFYAYHGCFREEQLVGNKFLVDIQLDVNVEKSAVSDKLEDALNYQIVYNLVKEQIMINSKLLENVAKRIMDAITSKFPEINEGAVKVSKMNPPLGGKVEKVSVEYFYP